MKKYRYVLWVVLVAIIICYGGCAAGSVSGTVEQKETYPVPSSSFNGYTGSESVTVENAVHIASAEPTPSPEVTPLPSPKETALPSLAVTPLPSPEPASAANPTYAPQATQIPSPEIVTDSGVAHFTKAAQIPLPIPASAASPTPAPTSTVSDASPTSALTSTGSDFIYPIMSFNDNSRICLTFDDGGDRKSIERALAALKKHEVKGTFFVIGKYLKKNEDLWKQAIEEGHYICNHSQNHTWLTDLNSEGAKKEILEWESSAAEVFGQEYVDKMKKEFPFIRLPGGAGNESKRVLRLVSELGYIPVGWNIESYYAVLRHHDLKTEPLAPIADEVFNHITKRAKGGSIILLHFNAYDTVKLDEIITAIKEKDLSMHLLTECLEY